jgi:hypothetical protein
VGASLEAIRNPAARALKSRIDSRRKKIGRAAAPMSLFFENGAAPGREEESNGR